MKNNKFYMVAALTIMIAITPVVGLAKENRGDTLKKVMENSTPAERANIQTDLMVETLEPREEQVEQIKAVNLKYAKKAEEIYNSQESKYKKFMKMRKMQNDKDKEFEAILTYEQYETYEQNKKKIRNKFKDKIQSQ
jgi:hypothetical protein